MAHRAAIELKLREGKDYPREAWCRRLWRSKFRHVMYVPDEATIHGHDTVFRIVEYKRE
jgi:hypothetical protein